MNLQNLSVLELDDLYYKRHAEGATLQELKAIRAVQEAKMLLLPLEERHELTRRIRDRYFDAFLSEGAKKVMPSYRNS